MFNKVNDYRKLTFVTYPGGNVLHTSKSTFDFDNGQKDEEKYLKESEKFKLISVKAQSDTSENATLTDDTLKITVTIDNYSFTYISAAGFINIAYAKVLAQMSDGELDKLQDKFRNREGLELPRMLDFQQMINDVVGEEKGVDIAFKAHVRIHNSYTTEHKNAIKYIIGHMVSDYKDNGDELVVESDDPELKNAIVDLGMSTYFDIDIED